MVATLQLFVFSNITKKIPPDRSKTKLVFDNDPTIDYEGPWTLNSTTVLVNNVEQPQTEHSTSTNGSIISLSFNGKHLISWLGISLMVPLGTQILVIGAVRLGQGPLMANYTIDNLNSQTHSAPILSQNTSLDFQTLFSSDILDAGKYTIVIEVLGTGVDCNYIFQNFQVTVPANSTDSSMDGSSTIRAKTRVQRRSLGAYSAV